MLKNCENIQYVVFITYFSFLYRKILGFLKQFVIKLFSKGNQQKSYTISSGVVYIFIFFKFHMKFLYSVEIFFDE